MAKLNIPFGRGAPALLPRINSRLAIGPDLQLGRWAIVVLVFILFPGTIAVVTD